MPSALQELLALLVYGPALVLLHELGHAALARAGGYRVSSFGVGLGRPLWRLALKHGAVLHVDVLLLAGGACVAIPAGPTGNRRAWFHTGGLLFQLALGVALWLLPDTWLLARVAQFNLLVAVTNAVPWRLGGMASDGWYLLDVALGGRRSSEILPQRALFRRLAQREAIIGSPLGQAWASVCLAWVDVLAGQPQRAEALFEEDPPFTVVAPWIDAVYAHLQAEWHRIEGRPLAALRTARDTRIALGPDLDPASSHMLLLAEARALVDVDSGDKALAVLGRMAGAGGMVGRQAMAVALAAQLDGEPEALVAATWRVLRHTADTWLDPVDAAVTLWEAAERLEEAGQVRAARGARTQARLLARRTVRSAAPEDRESLERRLGEVAGWSALDTEAGGS